MYICIITCIYIYLYVLEHGKLADMVRELSHGLYGVKHEQEYMEVRERMHRMSKYILCTE